MVLEVEVLEETGAVEPDLFRDPQLAEQAHRARDQAGINGSTPLPQNAHKIADADMPLHRKEGVGHQFVLRQQFLPEIPDHLRKLFAERRRTVYTEHGEACTK
jgi:hypothetical protein